MRILSPPYLSENKKNLAILSIGTNIGDRKNNIKNCIEQLNQLGKIDRCSSIYESEGWGNKNLQPFYNICAGILTEIPLLDFFQQLQEIERIMGRTPKIKLHEYEDRIIDIDIIYFGYEKIEEKEITVPHKELENRMFVLKPLAEIYPDLPHPVLNLTSVQLLKACKDQSVLRQID